LPIGIIQMDGYLEPFKDALKSRFSKAQKWIQTIEETEGGLEKFSRASFLYALTRAAWLTALRVTRSSASMSSPMAT
jgi:hypothetical protein